jgi:hypothetical protein
VTSPLGFVHVAACELCGDAPASVEFESCWLCTSCSTEFGELAVSQPQPASAAPQRSLADTLNLLLARPTTVLSQFDRPPQRASEKP